MKYFAIVALLCVTFGAQAAQNSNTKLTEAERLKLQGGFEEVGRKVNTQQNPQNW